MLQSLTYRVLMVRPANFGFNSETAINNAFQNSDTSESPLSIAKKAIEEFDVYVEKLKKVGIDVLVVQDTKEPVKPDAVFPNNWISFHNPSTIITYPMFSEKRRLERSKYVLDVIKEKFEVTKEIKYEQYEKEAVFLEGTGSMIFDRVHKIAYACESIRTDKNLFYKFCLDNDYEPVLFTAKDLSGFPIYHTNVMMCLGEDFVIVCLESVTNKKEREVLVTSFQKSNKEIIEISLAQVNQFAGNMLQLMNYHEDKYLVMSSTAYEALTKEQLAKIKVKTNILHSPLPTIEKYGGGSARCMIAELFLK